MSNRLERCYPNTNTNNNNTPPPPPLPRSPIPVSATLPPVPKSLPPLPPLPPVPPPYPPKNVVFQSEQQQHHQQAEYSSTNSSMTSVSLPLPMPILSPSTTWSQNNSNGFQTQNHHHELTNSNNNNSNNNGSIMDINTTTKSSALLDSHDRFKPERSQRRLVRNMKWTQASRWSRSTLAGDLFSCSNPSSPSSATIPNQHQHHFDGFLDLSNDQASSLQYCSINSAMVNGGENSGGLFTNTNFIPSITTSRGTPTTLTNLPLESESRVSSMTIADVSPRLAVKKVLLLYEHAQYREAAAFIQRLSISTFRIILRELPMDIFVEAMPHSLPIMESLYTKLFSSDGPNSNLKALKPETIVMHMVKFFSREEMIRESRKCKETIGPFTLGCKRILSVIVQGDPKIIKILQLRRKTLDKAVEGMGQHGLVGTTDESLLPLHDALKLELRRVVDIYKGALQKLEDLSLSNKNHPKTVAFGPAPIQASHQRQLSLRAEEIQDRLIKNKSLLNVIEPTLENHCLDILLGILQRRIECDKEALFQFTQLRKEAGDVSSGTVVAPLLMRYSKGVKQVLEMMREVAAEVGRDIEDYEDDSSDLSGYHSDSDSAIMTSGNSPYVTPRARYNFLSRSLRSKAMLRPTIMTGSSPGMMSSGSSGRFSSSAHSRSGSSGSSLPDQPDSFLSSLSPQIQNPSSTTNPVRPRHVKQKNQLHKNNSLASNSSSGESESSGSLRRSSSGPISPLPTNDILGCMDCVTVVSVPDNQVITQGLNHRCGQLDNNKETNNSPTSVNNNNNRLVKELRNEINQLRNNLKNANTKITQLQEFAGTSGIMRTFNHTNIPTPPTLDINGKEKIQEQHAQETRSYWIREYGALYATARVETMDALDALPELNRADELKSKLLFSVVVLSFRSVQIHLLDLKKKVQCVLQIDETKTTDSDINEKQLLRMLNEYLGNASTKFDLTKSVEQVAHQLWTTLYDYPCLKKCAGLIKYIQTCVNLAWGLLNQNPPCHLEYETRNFRRDMHVRFHSSDQSSDSVKTYLWPALLEGGPGGLCIHKGVVIT